MIAKYARVNMNTKSNANGPQNDVLAAARGNRFSYHFHGLLNRNLTDVYYTDSTVFQNLGWE